jgi:hypothetical protein
VKTGTTKKEFGDNEDIKTHFNPHTHLLGDTYTPNGEPRR